MACSGQMGIPMSLLPFCDSFLVRFAAGSVCFCLTRITMCKPIRLTSKNGINITCKKKNLGTVAFDGKSPANNRVEIQFPIHGTDFAI